MSPKRKKIQRVLSLREKKLDQRAIELEQSKSRLKTAKQEHSLESERLIEAAKRRAELADGRTDVGTWIEADQWLSQKQSDLRRADIRVAAAEASIQTALQNVVDARIDKRRIEILDEHLASGEARKVDKLEQRLTDEIARRRSRQNQD